VEVATGSLAACFFLARAVTIDVAGLAVLEEATTGKKYFSHLFLKNPDFKLYWLLLILNHTEYEMKITNSFLVLMNCRLGYSVRKIRDYFCS